MSDKRTPSMLDYDKLQQMDAVGVQLEQAAGKAWLSTGTRCPEGIHGFGRAALACKHCTRQDEVHPVGIVLMPKRYYVCMECLELIERKKFKYGTELIIVCRACVDAEITRLLTINPELFRACTVKG